MPSVPGWREAGKWILAGRPVYQAMEQAEVAELKPDMQTEHTIYCLYIHGAIY